MSASRHAVSIVLSLAMLGCSAASIALTPTEPAPEAPPPDALDVETTDHLGQALDLRAVVADKPTILVFYRGHW